MKKTLLVITGLFLITINIFSQADVRYDAGMNLPFNQKAGDVNPQTGNLTQGFTDVALPGRSGFNFSFGRIWNLNQSNVFNMYFKDGYNRLNSNTIDSYSRVGTGWSTSIPYIMSDDSTGQLVNSLFLGGNVYQIDTTTLNVDSATLSNILNYDLTDIRVYTKSIRSYSQAGVDLASLAAQYGVSAAMDDKNHYVVHLKSNEKYFFSLDGKLMMHEDKTGLNRIWYFYDAQRNLALVVDTVGREIAFSYDVNGNLSKIEWDVTIGTKAAGGTRSKVTEKRSVEYSYTSAETFPEVVNAKSMVVNYRTPYVLETVANQGGLVTKYEYQPGNARFSLHPSAIESTNVYMMLTGITDVFTAADGAYKNKRVFEYEVPLKGMYTKEGGSVYMEYYKISRQYLVNKNGRLFKDTRYSYVDVGENGNSNCYTAILTIGGLTTTYTYTLNNTNQDHVLDSLRIESAEGFLELHDYAYDDKRRKSLEAVYRQGDWVYQETFGYDDKGNLISHTDRGGLTTVTTYNQTYSIPITQEQTVTVQGAPVTYRTTNIINGLGQVTEQTLKEGTVEKSRVKNSYDSYGNLIAVENAEGVVTHTVYDSDYHTFPVKIYQHVDIADWTGGDVHSKWQDEPVGTRQVRIRSWKVFNSDGSIWIEVDNEGYAIEHYYDKLGTEIETVNPDLNDHRSFAKPIEVNQAGAVISGIDFDDFAKSTDFSAFLTSRVDNPGARMVIDYQQEFVKTYADIDKTMGTEKITGQEADGLGHVLRKIEYNGDGTEYAVTTMEYDSLGRMSAMTDPDAGAVYTMFPVNGMKVRTYDKTWVIRYDSLGRKTAVYYPRTRSDKKESKSIRYDDRQNIVITTDPEGRETEEHYDWKGNLIKVVRKGDYTSLTNPAQWEEYSFEYDKLNRKITFTDAKGLVTDYVYDARNLMTEQIFKDTAYSAGDVMEYNILGQLIKKTDRKGQVVEFEYDRMGRNTRAIHFTKAGDPTSDIVEMAYDNRGNAVRIANGNLIEHYIYDYANRVIKLERKLKDNRLKALIHDRVWNQVTTDTTSDTQIFSFSYTYNDAGMVTAMTYPDGSVHNFDYDPNLSRLEKITENSAAFVTNLDYNRSGVVTRMIMPTAPARAGSLTTGNGLITLPSKVLEIPLLWICSIP